MIQLNDSQYQKLFLNSLINELDEKLTVDNKYKNLVLPINDFKNVINKKDGAVKKINSSPHNK